MQGPSNNPVPDDDSTDDGMQNIELHRANSMVKSPIEFIADDSKDVTKEKHNVQDYISSKTVSFLSSLKQFKVEVIMFIYMFSYILRSVSTTTLILDKVCSVHLRYSEDVCLNLHHKEYADVKGEVEKLANNYSLGLSLIHMIPSAILSCFIGAWSDTYGRKVPIIAALLGIIIDGLGMTICAFYFYSRVEFCFIPGIFTGISGGFIGVLTIIYSYASDITKFGKRTMKYAFVEISFGLAMPLGQLTGGWIFRYYKYIPVFAISTAGHVFGLAWVLFVLEETRGFDNEDNWKLKFKNLWSMKPVMESIRATFKRRPNHGRKQILLLTASMSCAVLTLASTPGINILYLHHVLDWDNTMYSTATASFSVVGTVSLLVAVLIFKRMQLGDPALGIVGTTSMLLKNIGMGLTSSRKEMFYIGNVAGLLTGLSTLAGRSRISKVASKNDLGKIFAFLTTAESLLPIVASAIVSQVFNFTLDFYPGLIYFVLGSLLFIPLGVYIWLSRLPLVDYEDFHNEETCDDVESSDTNKETKSQKH